SAEFDKVGGGQLILPNASVSFTGKVDIQQGWITIQNQDALGGVIPTVSQNGQPTVTVEDGASLQLKPAPGQRFNLHQNFVLFGTGIIHPFVSTPTQDGISQEGAILSLEGVNTISGNIALGGQAGIGAELLDPGQFPAGQLYLTGQLTQKQALINVNAKASGN